MLRRLGKYEQDIGVRVVSGVTSGLLIILLGRSLTGTDFAHMQIYFSYGALLCWFFDFGLLGLAFVYAAQDNRSSFASCWRLRNRILALPVLTILIVIYFGNFEVIFAFLILIGMQESIVDSHLPLRQIFRSPLANTLSVVVRRVFQLLILVIIFFQGSSLNISHVLLVFGIPSFLVLISDLAYFSRFSGRLEIGKLKKSIKFFIQSTGTSIATLDYFLLGHFGFQNLVYPYTLGKKFYSFLMIPGTTLLQSTIKNEVQIGTQARNFWLKIKGALGITAILSFISAACFTLFADLFLGKIHDFGSIFIPVVLILLPILGSVTVNLNGILVSRSLFLRASIATFLSSFIYLLILIMGFSIGFNQYFVLVFALVINSAFELILELRLIFQYHPNMMKKIS